MDQVLPTPSYILGSQSTMITQEGHHGSSWNTVNRSADLAGNLKLQEGRLPLLPIMPLCDAFARDCVGQFVL